MTERLPLPEPHHWLYHNKTGVSVVHWSKQQPRWLADKSAASAFPDAHWFFDSFTADQMHAYAAAENAALRDEYAKAANMLLVQGDRIKLLEDALQFIAGHDLNGADDRARAIICGLFIIKAKKALEVSHD